MALRCYFKDNGIGLERSTSACADMRGHIQHEMACSLVGKDQMERGANGNGAGQPAAHQCAQKRKIHYNFKTTGDSIFSFGSTGARRRMHSERGQTAHPLPVEPHRRS